MAAKGLHAISRKVENPLQIIWCAHPHHWGVTEGYPAGKGVWGVRKSQEGAEQCEGVACREELEYIANTLIFVLSGVIIVGKIWESSSTTADDIRPADYGYALLLWFYLLVGRTQLQVPYKWCTCLAATPWA